MVYDEIIKDESGNGPLIKASKKTEPRQYSITIHPDDWKKVPIEDENGDGHHWMYEQEVYNDNGEQLRETSIIEISVDEDKTYKENSLIGKGIILKFIDEVYLGELIKMVAKNLIGTIYWKDEQKPLYNLCLIVQELPFLDTPASDFGL